jgi:phosphoribosylaminoimidazole-succinocarboxamide synthase
MCKKLGIVILSSGEGTTAKSVIKAVKSGIINCEILGIVTNRQKLYYSFDDEDSDIDILYIPPDISKNFNKVVLNNIFQITKAPDLVCLLGWNKIVTNEFIKSFKNVINLHPSLPGEYIGQGDVCIQRALNDCKTKTGSMVHRVTDDLDRGEVLGSIEVPILPTDTFDTLKARIKENEKGLVMSIIQKFIEDFNKEMCEELSSDKIYIGKVRQVEDIGYGLLLLTASDRLSAFDQYRCDVPQKGICLNNMSRWWFENTEHIIKNHYVYSDGKYMLAKKTDPIKLEVVVRGYMTGSSSTSIWTKYKNGEREIYGLTFRDGYTKNEKLDEIVITPTTKGVVDRPITRAEIIDPETGYLSDLDYTFIETVALELFQFGQEQADKRGLILVDTKYEFGKLPNGEIILIDEVHTCDSSRYWLKEDYEELFKSEKEPRKLDKDVVRDYIRANPEQAEVPAELVSRVNAVYLTYLRKLVDDMNYTPVDNFHTERHFLDHYFNDILGEFVVILAGSTSDSSHVEKIQKCLCAENIYSRAHFSSAHKNTREVLTILEDYNVMWGKRRIVFVTVAGRSNALSGVTACNTPYPVIACPPFSDKTDQIVNINSTLQCPSKVPVMTILDPGNVAISIRKIFDF